MRMHKMVLHTLLNPPLSPPQGMSPPLSGGGGSKTLSCWLFKLVHNSLHGCSAEQRHLAGKGARRRGVWKGRRRGE